MSPCRFLSPRSGESLHRPRTCGAIELARSFLGAIDELLP
jgi:hypothetical protein